MPTFDGYRPKLAGPQPAKICTTKFTTSGSTAALTSSSSHGCTVSRTGVGLFTVVLDRAYSSVVVGMSVTAQTTAQLAKIDSNDGQTIVIRQVTAGGNVAVDSAIMTIDVQMVCRG